MAATTSSLDYYLGVLRVRCWSPKDEIRFFRVPQTESFQPRPSS
jgi:hypothetical protein